MFSFLFYFIFLLKKLWGRFSNLMILLIIKALRGAITVEKPHWIVCINDFWRALLNLLAQLARWCVGNHQLWLRERNQTELLIELIEMCERIEQINEKYKSSREMRGKRRFYDGRPLKIPIGLLNIQQWFGKAQLFFWKDYKTHVLRWSAILHWSNKCFVVDEVYS